MREAARPSKVLFLADIPSPLTYCLANLPGQAQGFFAAEFFVVVRCALCLSIQGGLSGLIVAEKPNLFASHIYQTYPAVCMHQ
jgi:hypothetical protein